MEMYKAMKEAAGEQRQSMIAEVAMRLGRKPSVVYKWTQPCEDHEDSGQRGPALTLMLFMEACIALGRPREAALSPLRVLNQHFNQIVFDIPENVRCMGPDQLSKELIRCMKETGDVVRSYEKAMADEHMSRTDLAEFDRQIWEAVRELLVLLYCAQQSAGDAAGPRSIAESAAKYGKKKRS